MSELEAVDPTLPDQLARAPLFNPPPAQKRAAYARLKAADLSRRGLAFYQTPSGPKEITDPTTGTALTNFDSRHKIGYDSSGEPKRVSFDAGTGEPALSDPYQEAPQKTDKLGNRYSAPQGLPWRHVGVDPTIQADLQRKERDALNRETAAALAPVKAEAAKRYRDLFHVTKNSAKGTAEQLGGLGVSLTDDLGQPTVDLLDTDPATLRAQIETATNREYSAPEANASPIFGGSKYSSEAERLRTDIGARKQRALEIAEAHASTIGELRKSRAQLDEIEAQRKALSGDRLASVNARRQTAGMAAIVIPGLESDPQVSSYGPQQETTPERGAPLSRGNPQISSPDETTELNPEQFNTIGIPGLDDLQQGQSVGFHGVDLARNDTRKQPITAPQEARGILSEIGAGLVRGTGGVLSSLGGLVRALGPMLLKPVPFAGLIPGVDEVLTQGSEAVGGALKSAGESATGSTPISPDIGDFDFSSPRWWAARLPEVAPQLAAQLGIAALTAGASTPAQIATFAATGGGLMAGGVYNEAVADRIKKGESVEEARDGALGEAAVVGTIGAALEAIPGSEFLSKNPVLKPLIARVIRNKIAQRGVAGMLVEGPTEVGQEVAQDLAALGFRDDAARFENAWQRWTAAGLLGSVAGAGVNIALHRGDGTPPLPTVEPEVAPTDLQPLPESWIDVDDAGQAASPAPTEIVPAIPGVDEPFPTYAAPQTTPETIGTEPTPQTAPSTSPVRPIDEGPMTDRQYGRTLGVHDVFRGRVEPPAATTPFAAVLEKAQAEAKTPLEVPGLEPQPTTPEPNASKTARTLPSPPTGSSLIIPGMGEDQALAESKSSEPPLSIEGEEARRGVAGVQDLQPVTPSAEAAPTVPGLQEPAEALRVLPPAAPAPLLDDEYDTALEASRTANRTFAEIERAYRAKEIGDAEYLTARKVWKEAQEAFDEAEKHFFINKIQPEPNNEPETESPELPFATETKPETKRTFKRRVPDAPGGASDVINTLLGEVGQIKHPDTARRELLKREGKSPFQKTSNLGGEWDQWMNLPAALRKLVFSTGSNVNPDGAATRLGYESPDALRNALLAAWQTRLNAQRGDQQSEAFEKAASNPKSGTKIDAGELSVGDTVEVRGEKLQVLNVDEDGNVTLEDGAKFGIQEIQDGEFIYGELEKGPETAVDWPDMGLDPVSDDAKITTQAQAQTYAETLELIEPEPAAQPASTQVPGKEADAQRQGRAQQAESRGTLPRLASGQKSAELLQGAEVPFNLVSETATDKAARLRREQADEKTKEERETAEAKALQDKQQIGLFEKPSSAEPTFAQLQSEESFTPKQNTRHEAVVRKLTTVNRGPAEHLAAWVLKNTRWPKSVVLLHGTGASNGLQAAVTPISKRGKPFQVTFFDTGKDGTLEPFGDVPVDSLIDGIIEAQRRNFTDTREQKGYVPASETDVSIQPGARGKLASGEGQRPGAVSEATQSVPGARTPEALASATERDLGKVIALPKGATMLRAEDDLGRESIIPLSDLKGANVLQGAGPFRKLEAGTRDRKGNFVAIAEPVAVRTAPTARESRVEGLKNTIPAKEAFASAIQKFGKTNDIAEAGYILPDGTLLDFTGRASAGYVRSGDQFVPRPGERDWMRGDRGTDHREVEWDGMPDYKETWEPMVEFMRMGAVRIDKSGAISLHGRSALTNAQKSRISDLLIESGGEAHLDLEDDAGKRASFSIRGAKASKIAGIVAKWAAGQTPDDLHSARFSQSESTGGEPLPESAIQEQLLAKFGLDPSRHAVRIVNEPDAVWDARWMLDGSGIEINAAKVRSLAQLERAVLEELAHGFTEDPSNAKATQEFMDALTPAERSEIDAEIERLGYSEETTPFEQRAKAVRDLVSTWNNRTWFKKLLGRILAWARKAGLPLTRLSAESLAVDAALRTAKGVRESTVKPISRESRVAAPNDTTSTKRAVKEAEREERGVAPTGTLSRPDRTALIDAAQTKLAANPDAGRALVREINDGPFTWQISDEQEALLAAHKREVRTEKTAQMETILDESKSQAERDVATERWNALEAENEAIDHATNKTGSAWHRWGMFRMQELKTDWSFENLVRQERKATGGQPMTPEREAELQKQADEREKQFDAEIKRREQLYEIDKIKAVDAAIVRTKEEARRNAPNPRVQKHSEEFIKRLAAKVSPDIDRALALFSKPTGGARESRVAAPGEPEGFDAAISYGALKMAKRNLTRAEWEAEMKAELPELNMNAHGDTLWAEGNKLLDAEIAADTSEVAHVKKTRMKANASKDQLVDGIEASIAEGNKISDLGRYIKKLALQFIREGINTREPLIDALHNEVKDIDPRLDRETVMDLFSDYGQFDEATTDPVKVKAAQIRGEVQQARKLIDMARGIAGQMTGRGRVTPSDAYRMLTKLVEDAKRRGGFKVTDPARQIKTALDAIKTRLKNEIADMDFAIANRTPLAEHKNAVTYDAETLALKDARKVKKAEYEKLFPKDTKAAELAVIARALDKSIAEAEAQLKAGKLYPDAPGLRLTSPEIEAKRARLAALRDERQVLRGLDTIRVEADKMQAVQDRIDELQKQRAAGWPESTKTGTPTADTAALAALKAQREKLFKERSAAQHPPKDEETRRLESLDKAIAAKEAKIAAGDTSTKPQSQNVKTAEVSAKEAELRALNEQLADMRRHDIGRQLEQWKARATRRLAELEAKIAAGDFAQKPKPPAKVPDKELLAIQFRLAEAEQAILRGRAEAERANRSVPKRVVDAVADTFHTLRSLMTGGEFSGVLRQGKLAALSHPILTAKGAAPDMFRAFRSKEGEHAAMTEINARANAPLYLQTKLAVHDPANFTAAQLEGNYRSRWANKIPFIAGSGRAYTMFLNRLRADLFDSLYDKLAARAGPPNIEQAKVIAQYVNEMTGSGGLGVRGQKAAEALNVVFFAPKYVMSRFQMLSGHSMWRGDAQTKRLVAEEYGRILLGMAVMYSLYAALGDDKEKIETDPRSSKFGKIPAGHGTYLDPMAGLIQATVFMSRLASGHVKDSKGNVVPIRQSDTEKVKFGRDNAFDLIARFTRSKASPIAGAVIDQLNGTDFMGQPLTVKGQLINLATPMTYGDIYDAMKAQGAPKGTILSTLALFGEGLNTYVEKPKPLPKRTVPAVNPQRYTPRPPTPPVRPRYADFTQRAA